MAPTTGPVRTHPTCTDRSRVLRLPLVVLGGLTAGALCVAPASALDAGPPTAWAPPLDAEEREHDGHEAGEEDEEDGAGDPLAGVHDVVVTVTAPATAQEVADDYGLTVVGSLPVSRDTHLLRAPVDADVVDVAAAVAADPRVAAAEPDYMTTAPEGVGTIYGWGGGPRPTGTDGSGWVDQDALRTLGVPEAHAGARGEGVVVAVLDTGVDLDHPALAPALVPGVDLVDGDGSPDDVGNGLDDDRDGLVDEGRGHGTHVAGLVRAVAPEARLLPVRVLDTESRGSVFTVATGIERAVAAGADVLTLSLGTPAPSAVLDDVLDEVSEDVVVVAAAGNTGDARPVYPGATDGVLSVASVDPAGLRSDFSTYGWVDVAAPGEALVSTWVDGGYAEWGGTSMAAPLVAGQAALLLGRDGEDREGEDREGEDGEGEDGDAGSLDARQVVRLVTSTAVDAGPGLGAGRVDVAASLAAAGPSEDD